MQTDTLLTSSSRLVMLKYRSWLLRTMDTLVYAPLYLVGYLEETQLRRIDLFRNYNENVFRPTSTIALEISNVDIQVYDAVLMINTNFYGLKYLMYQWPLTMAIVGAVAIFSMLLVVLCSSWLALAEASKKTSSPSSSLSYQTDLKPALSTPGDQTSQPEEQRELTPLSRVQNSQASLRSVDHDAVSTNMTADKESPVASLGVTGSDPTIDTEPISSSTHVPTVRQRRSALSAEAE